MCWIKERRKRLKSVYWSEERLSRAKSTGERVARGQETKSSPWRSTLPFVLTEEESSCARAEKSEG